MKKAITRHFLLFIVSCWLYTPIVFGQTKDRVLDSLLLVIKKARADTSKVNAMNSLSEHVPQKGDWNASKKYADEALLLAGKIGFKTDAIRASNEIGYFYNQQTSYPESLRNHSTALALSEEIEDKEGIADSYYYMGILI